MIRCHPLLSEKTVNINPSQKERVLKILRNSRFNAASFHSGVEIYFSKEQVNYEFFISFIELLRKEFEIDIKSKEDSDSYLSLLQFELILKDAFNPKYNIEELKAKYLSTEFNQERLQLFTEI